MLRNCVLFAIAVLILSACRAPKQGITQVTSENKKYLFPLDWIGHYQGKLSILNPNNDTSVVDMQLIIDQPDALGYYPWVIIYGEKDIRSYGLEAVDIEKGHYRIDEYNSVLIDSYLAGNHFVSRFEVLGTDLIVDYEKNESGILVKLYVSQAQQQNVTGGAIIGQDTVPLVNSYRILAVQEALLKQIK